MPVARLHYRTGCTACERYAAIIVAGSGGRVTGHGAAHCRRPILEIAAGGRSLRLRGRAAVAGFVLAVGPRRSLRVRRAARAAGVFSLP